MKPPGGQSLRVTEISPVNNPVEASGRAKPSCSHFAAGVYPGDISWMTELMLPAAMIMMQRNCLSGAEKNRDKTKNKTEIEKNKNNLFFV